jgi:tripartite-type tricarboxylate transporter receptor subunit TctC
MIAIRWRAGAGTRLCFWFLAIGLTSAIAHAQSFPDKPIRLIVPGAAGGPTDMPARIVSQFLPRLGQPAVIENRPGAGGAIGARFVAAAPPDGHTLLVANTSVLAVFPAVSANPGYDPTTSFAPVAKFSESFQILVVPASAPWKSLKELLDDARAHPGKLNYAHTGAGGLPHLTGELFLARTGVNIIGVPYRSGGESVTAVLSQAVHMTFEGITILLPLIREGKLRALAVTSRTRTSLAPDLPTMIEAGVPDYEVTTFNGFMAPAGTPDPVIAKLNATINEGLAAPGMQDTITRLGAVTNPGTAQDFGTFIAVQLKKWTDVARAANIKMD